MPSLTQHEPELILLSEYRVAEEEHFLCLYDAEHGRITKNMFFATFREDDKQLADKFAYLGYRKPRASEVTVPAGAMVKVWAWPSSNVPYIYEVQSLDAVKYGNDRNLPTSAPRNNFTESLKMVSKMLLKQECRFVRLYDKKTFDMEGLWLFDPEQVNGKTPEELQRFLALPFIPTFICDAVAKPPSLMLSYTIPATKGDIYQIEGGLSFLNERPLSAPGGEAGPQVCSL